MNSQENFDHWIQKGVTSKTIAKGLHEVSNGDKRVLSTSEDAHKSINGIWGKAVAVIFPGEKNTLRERFLIYRFWNLKRKNVVLHYDIEVAKQKSRLKQSQERKEESYKGCLCDGTYQPLRNDRRIQCSSCDRWYHSTCAGIDIDAFGEDDTLICDVCKGNLQIPEILQETRSSKSSQEIKAVEDTHEFDEANEPGSADSGSDYSLISVSDSDEHSDVEQCTDFTAAATDTPVVVTTPAKDNDKNDLQSLNERSTRRLPNLSRGRIRTPQVHCNDENKMESKLQETQTSPNCSTKSFKMNENLSPPVYTSTPTGRPSQMTKGLYMEAINKNCLSYDDDDVGSDFDSNGFASGMEDELDISDEMYSSEELESDSETDNDEDKSPSTVEDETTVPVLDTKEADLPIHEDSSEDLSEDEHTGQRKSARAEEPITKKPYTKKGLGLVNKDKLHITDDEDDEKDPVIGERIDTSKVPTAFSFEVSQDEWRNVVILRKNKSGLKKTHFRCPKFWTNTISRAFDKENKVCVLSFNKKVLGEPLVLNTPFWTAYSKCNNAKCSARWRFVVKKKPKEGQDVKVYASLYKGEMIHHRGVTSSRKWTGDYKDDVRNLLKSKMPAAARLERAAKCDMEAVKNGKLTELKGIKAFQMQKEKMDKEGDLDRDVVLDVLKSRPELKKEFPDKEYPGYIRAFQIFPARIVLYSFQQMEMLKNLQKLGPVQLFLDATGSICKPLGEQYDPKEILLYTVLVQSPVPGYTALPLLEMLTSDNKHSSIYSFLYTFFHSYQTRFNINERFFGIEKFEIDFSKPFLTSLVRLFAQSRLDSYLNAFWHHYVQNPFNEQIMDMFPVHVCRFHVLKAMKKKATECYQSLPRNLKSMVLEVIIDWTKALVRSKDLHSFDRRTKEIGIITLFEYYTPYVAKQIRELHVPTKRDSIPWKSFEFEDVASDAPFWFRSAFGQYSYSIFSICEERNNDIKIQANQHPANPYYCKEFADYLRTYFLPYFPVITHMVLTSTKVRKKSDTNNPVEGHFSLMKTNIYKNRKHQKVSRFIRRQAMVIKGIANTMTSTLYNVNCDPNVSKSHKQDKTSQKANDKIPNFKTHYQAGLGQGASSLGLDPEAANGRQKKSTKNCEETPNDNADKFANLSDDQWNVFQVPLGRFKGKNFDRKDPDSQKERFKKPFKTTRLNSLANDFMDSVPTVPWGGRFLVDNTKLRNTCSLDTTLQCLVGICIHFPEVSSYIDAIADAAWNQDPKRGSREIIQSIMKTIKHAEGHQFDAAKTLWLSDIMKTDPGNIKQTREIDGKQVAVSDEGNLRNSEFNSAFKFAALLVPVKKYHRCSDEKCIGFKDPVIFPEVGSRAWKWEHSDVGEVLKWTPSKFEHVMNNPIPYRSNCHCGSPRVIYHKFMDPDQPFIFYPLLLDEKRYFKENRLRLTQTFNGKTYDLFAYTCVSGTLTSNEDDKGIPHFITKFVIGGKRIIYDGMTRKPVVQQKLNNNHKVTSVWLIPRK